MNDRFQSELQNKFSKSLDELYEVLQKNEPKRTLSYGQPMNLKPVVSSLDVYGATELRNQPPKSLEALVKKYGAIKEELNECSKDISVLSSLEAQKKEYVKKRDGVWQISSLNDFEKLNRDRLLKLELKKVKESISDVTGRIDQRMEKINSNLHNLNNLCKTFERKYNKITILLNGIKKGIEFPANIAEKIQGVNPHRISNYKRDLADGIILCEQIISKVKERKDSLVRTMWMESPVIGRRDPGLENIDTNLNLNNRVKNLNKENGVFPQDHKRTARKAVQREMQL